MVLKKLIAATALTVMFTLTAIAQHPRTILSHTEALGLTEAQVASIEKLHAASRPTKSAVKGVPRKVDRNAKPQLYKTGLEEILTEEQMLKWKEITAMRTEGHQTKRDDDRADKKGLREQRQAYIAENIAPAVQNHRLEFEKSLSNAEKETIAAARTERAQARSLPTDSRNKISKEDKKARHQGLSEIVSNHKEELDAIWVDLGDKMTTWNEALVEMEPSKKKNATKNRGEHAKNRARGHKGGKFSHFEFVLIDY